MDEIKTLINFLEGKSKGHVKFEIDEDEKVKVTNKETGAVLIALDLRGLAALTETTIDDKIVKGIDSAKYVLPLVKPIMKLF